jgi:hypothetical protein
MIPLTPLAPLTPLTPLTPSSCSSCSFLLLFPLAPPSLSHYKINYRIDKVGWDWQDQPTIKPKQQNSKKEPKEGEPEVEIEEAVIDVKSAQIAQVSVYVHFIPLWLKLPVQ